MDNKDHKKPKITKKSKEASEHEDEYEAEGEGHPDHDFDEDTDASKHMAKKKNLQIEVIEHPEASAEAENMESGDASGYEQTDPNQYSEQEEPNHRKGTDNEPEQYQDSMEAADGQNKQSYQSFGNQDSQADQDAPSSEEHKIRNNAKNAKIKNKINEGLLNDFIQNKKKDSFEHTQKVHHEEGEGEEYTEEEPDEDKIDDDLVEKQQREAEELLNEANQAVHEDYQEDASIEEEEDEVEEIAKQAEENKIEEMNPEEEEDEEEIEDASVSKGNKFELNYTVGRIEDGAAILISKDHNLVEIPL